MTYGDLRFQLMKLLPGTDPDVLDTAVNNRLESICRHLPWKALEADGILSTVKAFQGQGTVSLTAGSNAVTLTGAAFTAQMTGRKFKTPARAETYTFTYGNASAGTLDRPYEGDTDAAAADFLLYQNVYALPADYGEPIRGRNERIPTALEYMDRTLLDDAAPARGRMVDEPLIWCEATRGADGTRYAELFPAPEFAAAYPFRYRRELPQLTDDNAGDELPAWISKRGLMAGVKADITRDRAEEATFQVELADMRRVDAAARGPQKIRVADWMARPSLDRMQRNYRRHLP